MPSDITHCCGQACPLQESCLRCTAGLMGRQGFFTRSPYDVVANHCDYYWDDRPAEEKISQLAYQFWVNSGYQQGNALANWLQARTPLIDNLRNS